MAATTFTDTAISGEFTFVYPEITSSTNLGSLGPTSFPANCLAILWDLQTTGLGDPFTYRTQGCAVSTCCPSGHFYTESWAWLSSYYSPGVCPSQYHACDPPESAQALATSNGESIAFCCPTSYVCPSLTGTDPHLQCESLIATRTQIVVLNDIYDQIIQYTRTLNPEEISVWNLAYPIQVRIKPGHTVPTAISSSNSSSPVPGTTPRSASVSITTPATSAATTSTTTVPSANGSQSLSGGAIAGIVIGVVFGIAIVGLLIWILLVLRCRGLLSSSQPADKWQTDQSHQSHALEMASLGPSFVSSPNELPVGVAGESQHRRSELPTNDRGFVIEA